MLQPGTAVGDYRVVRKLGEGGMGEVYLAVHDLLRRRVVLKGLHPQYASDPGVRDRLRREAEAMARLSHPNIVTLYGFIETEAGAFIAMEFVDGATLDELLHRHGPAPLHRVIELVRPALAAIDYAHQKGVIHRDLKPANIMLGADGNIRVMDFGTAKVVDRPGLTRVGMTLGTATYMPPEQVMGENLTPATDVYAMGVTLFELATGHLPFESDDGTRLMRRICEDPAPSPSLYVPSLPKVFDALVARCLAKRAADRYQSARELLAALEKVAESIRTPSDGAIRTPPPVASAAARGASGGAGAASNGAGAHTPAPARGEVQPSPAAAVAATVIREVAAAPGATDGAVAPGEPVPGAVAVLLGVLLSGIGLAAALGAVGLHRLGHAGEGDALGLSAAAIWAIGTAALGAVTLSRARAIERALTRSAALAAALASALAAVREAAANAGAAASHARDPHSPRTPPKAASYGWALQQPTVASRPVPSGGELAAWRHRPFEGPVGYDAPADEPQADAPAAARQGAPGPTRTLVASVEELHGGGRS